MPEKLGAHYFDVPNVRYEHLKWLLIYCQWRTFIRPLPTIAYWDKDTVVKSRVLLRNSVFWVRKFSS